MIKGVVSQGQASEVLELKYVVREHHTHILSNNENQSIYNKQILLRAKINEKDLSVWNRYTLCDFTRKISQKP